MSTKIKLDTAPINARIPRHLRDRLRAQSQVQAVSISELVRKAIDDHLVKLEGRQERQGP